MKLTAASSKVSKVAVHCQPTNGSLGASVMSSSTGRAQMKNEFVFVIARRKLAAEFLQSFNCKFSFKRLTKGPGCHNWTIRRAGEESVRNIHNKAATYY